MSNALRRAFPYMRRIILPFMAFLCTMGFVGIMATEAQISKDTRDAVQDERIEEAIRANDLNSIKIEALSKEVSEIKSGMDRLTGVGESFGIILTGLFGLDIFLRTRGKA